MLPAISGFEGVLVAAVVLGLILVAVRTVRRSGFSRSGFADSGSGPVDGGWSFFSDVGSDSGGDCGGVGDGGCGGGD